MGGRLLCGPEMLDVPYGFTQKKIKKIVENHNSSAKNVRKLEALKEQISCLLEPKLKVVEKPVCLGINGGKKVPLWIAFLQRQINSL